MKAGRRRFPNYQQRLWLLAVLCGLPGLLAALALLLLGGHGPKIFFTVLVLATAPWLFFTIRLQAHLFHPVQTASNMLAALREGDFSLKAGQPDPADAMGQLLHEINRLSDVLSSHRMDALESHALLDKVIQEIDAAVFAFDPDRRLHLANPAALRLLDLPRAQSLSHYAAELNLDKALQSPPNAVIPHPLPDRPGRFTVRRGSYRVGGRPHELLILIDVSQTLRKEELMAWKRLLRVLGHELNNSMAPIRSLAESLQRVAAIDHPDPEDRADLREGLQIIQNRSESLSRFIGEYARMAKLPPPKPKPFSLHDLLARLAALFDNPPVHFNPPKQPLTLTADPDLLEQAFLNLIKNAVESARLNQGSVSIQYRLQGAVLLLFIDDTGPGIANPDNLFVPFFSTKKEGSGIGLTLSRQIIESHDGTLALANHADSPGCRATVTLPLR